jgi:hypothetical protein
VSVIFMLFSGVAWAQIIGEICGIAAQGDPVELEYYQKSDDMNRLMGQMKLEPQSLRVAVRELILRSKNSMSEQARRNVLKSLSGNLAGEVACEGPRFIKGRMFSMIHAPCSASATALAAIVTGLKSLTVPPVEALVASKNRLYILRSGTVCLNAASGDGGRRIMLPHWPTLTIVMKSSKNTTWNNDLLIRNPVLRENVTARTLVYVDADYIDKDTLTSILDDFPEVRGRFQLHYPPPPPSLIYISTQQDKKCVRINTIFATMRCGLLYVAKSGGFYPSGYPCEPFFLRRGDPVPARKTYGSEFSVGDLVRVKEGKQAGKEGAILRVNADGCMKIHVSIEDITKSYLPSELELVPNKTVLGSLEEESHGRRQHEENLQAGSAGVQTGELATKKDMEARFQKLEIKLDAVLARLPVPVLET